MSDSFFSCSRHSDSETIWHLKFLFPNILSLSVKFEEKLKVQNHSRRLIMDRELNPIVCWHVFVPAEICRRWDASCNVWCTCQHRALFLEDTDGVIHQAETRALEEWRTDKVDSFENNDDCRCSEWIVCLLGSIKAYTTHPCCVKCLETLRDSRVSSWWNSHVLLWMSSFFCSWIKCLVLCVTFSEALIPSFGWMWPDAITSEQLGHGHKNALNAILEHEYNP